MRSKLEIRPEAWWFNEVKAIINDPGRIEKRDAAADEESR